MHSRQVFLDKINVEKSHATKKQKVSMINWNISNPSLQRAIKQVEWLVEKNPDIIVLTETKFSKGCAYIRDRLESFGYDVILPKSKVHGYGVLLASKLRMKRTDFSDHINSDTRARAVSIELPFINAKMEVIAVYVPNRRDETKKRFLQTLLQSLNNSRYILYRIFCGDFNVVEPDHVPSYPKFESWEYNFYSSLSKHKLEDAFRHLNPRVQEYSWMGRAGDGYRYDHCFVSVKLLPFIVACYYLHEPRKIRYSDHSAMYLCLSSA